MLGNKKAELINKIGKAYNNTLFMCIGTLYTVSPKQKTPEGFFVSKSTQYYGQTVAPAAIAVAPVLAAPVLSTQK